MAVRSSKTFGFGVLVANLIAILSGSEDGASTVNENRSDGGHDATRISETTIKYVPFQDTDIDWGELDKSDTGSLSTATSCEPIVRPLPSGHVVLRRDGDATTESTLSTRETQEDADTSENSYEDGVNELFIACQRGESGIVRMILERGSIDVNMPVRNTGVTFERRIGKANWWMDGWTPLLIACSEGHKQVVEQLLSVPDVKVNKGNENGMTPLHEASSKGHNQVVLHLLSHPQIDVNIAAASTGRTPLYSASGMGNAQVVSRLLSHPQIDVNAVDMLGKTPLYIACEEGHTKVVSHLLSHPQIDVEKANKYRKTPLDIASVYNYTDIVKLLLHYLGNQQNYEESNKSAEAVLDAPLGAPVKVPGDRKRSTCLIQ